MSQELDGAFIRKCLPERPEAGHKGTFGHVFVLAGSRGFTGAAKLTCTAAYRAGAGLVTLATPHPLGDIMAVALTETMTCRLASTAEETFAHVAVDKAVHFAQGKNAVVIGPGMSRHPETVGFVQDVLPQFGLPLVVDADALNALSEQPELLHEIHTPCILTPHPGEMARLVGCSTKTVQADRVAVAQALAQEMHKVVVLKGFRTVVADPSGQTCINPTGNQGMGTGGVGDVLAGLLGGLLAQGIDAFEAACLGVYLHGLAGDLAAEKCTARALMARDVLNALPAAWQAVEAE